MKIKDDVSYKITVVGTGATGSHFVSNFTQIYSNFDEEIESLLLIDGDHFEEKNLRNQKCLVQDINNNKAQVLSDRFTRIYPNTKINYYDEYIEDAERLREIMSYRPFLSDKQYLNASYVEIIIGTVDNDKTRSIIDDLVRIKRNKNESYIYIDSGNSTDSMQGQVYLNYNFEGRHLEGEYGWNDKIFNKFLTDIYPDVLESKEDDIKKLVGCAVEVNEKPQLLPTNLMAANLLTQIMYKIVVSHQLPESYLYVFDAKNITSTFVKT